MKASNEQAARHASGEEDPALGWLILLPEQVPPRWKARARAVALIPLLPEEADGVLTEGRTDPVLDEEDEQILRLAATGLSVSRIAHELGVTPRTVSRRLARLRERFRIRSNAELAVLLAKRGF